MKHGRISETQFQNQLQEQIQSRRVLQERYVEKWAKNTIGGKDLQRIAGNNPTKARNIAMALQAQESHLRSLGESVVSTSFSVRPENLLRAVKIGVANSNRGDIFTEYPLQTTDDAIFYIWMTYEQSLRGSTADQRIYEKINQFYAGEQHIQTLATGNGGTKAYTLAAVTYLPVIPRTVNIIVGGALVAKDNGDATISDFTNGTILNTASTNTVVYATGVVTLNFVDNVANGAAIQVMYNWSSENSDNFAALGTVGITLEKKRFNARPMPLGYNYSMMTQITLKTTGIGSAEDLLMTTVGEAHAQSRDYKAVQRARQIANSNATATFDCDFAAVGEISLKSHAQNIIKAINEVGASIYDDIKRGMINKAIVGSRVLPFLKLNDLWKDDMTQPRSGLYKAGTLSDIEVYVCPAQADMVLGTDMILTYKNPQEGLDLSIVFGVLTEIDAALNYPEFYTKGYKATVEDSIIVNPKFCRLLQLSNLSVAA